MVRLSDHCTVYMSQEYAVRGLNKGLQAVHRPERKTKRHLGFTRRSERPKSGRLTELRFHDRWPILGWLLGCRWRARAQRLEENALGMSPIAHTSWFRWLRCCLCPRKEVPGTLVLCVLLSACHRGQKSHQPPSLCHGHSQLRKLRIRSVCVFGVQATQTVALFECIRTRVVPFWRVRTSACLPRPMMRCDAVRLGGTVEVIPCIWAKFLDNRSLAHKGQRARNTFPVDFYYRGKLCRLKKKAPSLKRSGISLDDAHMGTRVPSRVMYTHLWSISCSLLPGYCAQCARQSSAAVPRMSKKAAGNFL